MDFGRSTIAPERLLRCVVLKHLKGWSFRGLEEVARARALGLARGHCLRTDTTAVETNIHHPSDSSLLADCLRVLTRSLQRISQSSQQEGGKVVDHARATNSAAGDRPGGQASQ